MISAFIGSLTSVVPDAPRRDGQHRDRRKGPILRKRDGGTEYGQIRRACGVIHQAPPLRFLRSAGMPGFANVQRFAGLPAPDRFYGVLTRSPTWKWQLPEPMP